MQIDQHARLAIGLATLIAAIVSPAMTGHLRPAEAQQVADTRERVRLAAAERESILLEMRTMLLSLSSILQGLVAGDLAKVERSARASGMAAAVDSSLEKKLPPEFHQMGVRTHKKFDALADAAKAGVTRDRLLKMVAGLTPNCVTCHGMYRLDEAR